MAKNGASPDFVISRDFDAPGERVRKEWTERGRLMQWFGLKVLRCAPPG